MNSYKILLLQPYWSVREMYGKSFSIGGGYMIPHGVASIIAVCEENGYRIDFLDVNIERFSYNQLFSYLQQHKYDIIGMSCYTPNANRVYETAKLCKKINKNCTIVLGGAHPVIFKKKIFEECDSIDICVIGEGEYTFLEIINTLKDNYALNNVKGIIYKDNGNIIETSSREIIKDLDRLPFPAYYKFRLEKYVPSLMHTKTYPTVAVILSRGCPFRCTFCGHKIISKEVRVKSAEYVKEELELLYNKYGVRGITIQDSTFTHKKEWVIEICNQLINSELELSWQCNARVDQVDKEMLQKMKQAGCWKLTYGIESGVQESLNKIKKGFTLEQVRKAIKLTQEVGINIQASYILGFPWENEKMVRQTISFAKELATTYAIFYILVPYPGTEIWDIAWKYGGFVSKNLSWDDFGIGGNIENPVYIAPSFTKKSLQKIYRYAYISYYLTPKVIWQNLKLLTSISEIKKLYTGIKIVFRIISRKIISK